jgi:putative sigma-54 modulation protein
METQIQSLHFSLRPGLQNFIYEKMDKLEKLYNRLEAAMVVLKLENTARKDNKEAEVSLRMPGLQMFAKETAETFEEAVVSAIEEIRHQLQRHKEKMGNVHPNGHEVEETDLY